MSAIQSKNIRSEAEIRNGQWFQLHWIECRLFNSFYYLLFKVFFVDFGNLEEIDLFCVFELPESLIRIPYLAFECKLVQIKPANEMKKWTKEENDFFKNCTNNKCLEIEVGFYFLIVPISNKYRFFLGLFNY